MADRVPGGPLWSLTPDHERLCCSFSWMWVWPLTCILPTEYGKGARICVITCMWFCTHSCSVHLARDFPSLVGFEEAGNWVGAESSIWLMASKKLKPWMNSANILCELGSRSFPSQVLYETAALADTLTAALWDPKRKVRGAVPRLLIHRNF